jgi:hypothetical protein
MMDRKGQVFFMAALVIVTSIFVMRLSTSSASTIEERRAFESRLEGYMFQNFVAELRNSVQYSLYAGKNVTQQVHDFANFTKLKSAEHSLGMQMIFIGSVANKTTDNLNVSFINMMGDSIAVNLTVNGRSAATTVADYGRWDTNFTIDAGTNYVMTAIYNSTTQSVPVKTKHNKDVYNSFFDVTLIGDSSMHKDVESANYNLK